MTFGCESFFGILSILNHLFGVLAFFLDLLYFKLEFSLLFYVIAVHFGIKILSVFLYSLGLISTKFNCSCSCNCNFRKLKKYQGGTIEDTFTNAEQKRNTQQDDEKISLKEGMITIIIALNMLYNYRIFPIGMTIILILPFSWGTNLLIIFCIIQIVIYFTFSVLLCTTKHCHTVGYNNSDEILLLNLV